MWALRGGNHPAQQDVVRLSSITQRYHNRAEHFLASSTMTFRLIKGAFVFCCLLREKTSTRSRKLRVAWRKKCSWKVFENKSSDLNINIFLFLSYVSLLMCFWLNTAFVLQGLSVTNGSDSLARSTSQEQSGSWMGNIKDTSYSRTKC